MGQITISFPNEVDDKVSRAARRFTPAQEGESDAVVVRRCLKRYLREIVHKDEKKTALEAIEYDDLGGDET